MSLINVESANKYLESTAPDGIAVSKAMSSAPDLNIDLSSGLVAHYLLNNNADDCHGTYDGTPSGGVDFQGDLANFNGVDGVITTPYGISDFTTQTFSVWSKTNDTSKNQSLFCNGWDGVDTFVFEHNTTSGINFGIRTPTGTYEYKSTSNVITVNTLHHIALVKSALLLTLYIDGQLIDSVIVSSDTTVATNILIGSRASNVIPFDGNLSNIRIYSDAKDQEFIDNLYAEGYYPKPLTLPRSDGPTIPEEEEVDLTVDLISHYLLNNNADDCHGAFDASETNIVFKGDEGEFNGASYAISNLPEPAPANKTFSVWFKAENVTATQSILSVESDLNIYQGTSLFIESSQLQAISRDGGGAYKAISTAFTDTLEYHHAVVVVSDSVILLYLDSVLMGSLDMLTTGADGGRLKIGASGEDSLNFLFNGNISNVRIYSKAKNQAFINGLHAEGYYPKPLTEPTTTNLVAHYPLTGTAEDSTGNYDGTEMGNTYVDNGEFGSAASFDGINDYISNPSLSLGTTRTYSFWIDVNSNPNHYVIDFTTGRGIFAAQTQNVVSNTSGIYDGNVWHDLNYSFSSDTVYHVVVLWETTSLTVYVNDSQIYTSSATISAVSGTFSIGADHAGGANFNGEISRVRLYNASLTAQQITDIYNYEKNFRHIDIDDGLIAYYPLANNSLDNYYNEYDGTDISVSYDGLSASVTASTGEIRTIVINPRAALTLGGWIYTPNDTTGVMMSSDHDSGSTWPTIRLFSNGFDIHNQSTLLVSDSFTKLSGWHHVILTCTGDNGEVKYYRDGELLNTYQLSGAMGSASKPYSLLNEHTGTWGNSLVRLAKYRIHNKAITAEQVKVIYNEEAIPPEPLDTNLVAHYLLNHGAADETGNNDGTVVGDIEFTGDMAYFDGTDKYIDTGISTHFSEITVSMWIKPYSTGSNPSNSRIIFGNSEVYASAHEKFPFIISYNIPEKTIVFRLSKGDDYSTDYVYTAAVALTELTHITFSYKANTRAEVAINGVIVDSSAIDFSISDSLLNYCIGHGHPVGDGADAYCFADIANTRIYSDVKDQAFIASLYAEGCQSPDVSRGYFPFTGDSLTDASGNLTLTNTGGTFVDTPNDRGVELSDTDYLSMAYTIPASGIIDITVNVKTTTIGTAWPDYNNTILGFNNGTDRGISLMFGHNSNVGTYYLSVLDRGSIGIVDNYTDDNVWSLNTYYDIRFLQDTNNKTIKVYLDDMLVIDTTYTSVATQHTNIQFGNEYTHTDYDLDGVIEEIYLFGQPRPILDCTPPTTTGLIAHYPLTGTAEDATGNYNGTEVGITYIDDSEFGSVANFIKDTSYINTGVTPNLTTFSISLWVKSDLPSDTFGYITTLNNTGTDRGGFEIIQSGSTIKAVVTNVSGSVTMDSFIAPSSSQYRHIVLTYNNGSIELSIDNGTPVLGTSLIAFFYSTIHIGSYYASLPTTHSLDGKIRNVRVYNSVLTPQEITDIYNYEKNFRPIDIDDGLIAYYPLKNNSLDNYYNENDGVDTAVTYDGTSAIFTGNSQHIQTSAHTNTQGAISLWVKRTASTVEQYRLWSQSNIGGGGTEYISGKLLETFKVQFNHRGHNIFAGSTVLALDEWYHVVYQSDGSAVTAYLNGVPEVLTTLHGVNTGQWLGDIANSDNFCINRFYRDGTDDSSGHKNLANFRIYDKTLTPEQVKVIYDKENMDNHFALNISKIKNIFGNFEFNNISAPASVADTLITNDLIIDGDTLVIVKDDDGIHEITASGVTGTAPGPYELNTTSITAGEIPSRVFRVNESLKFNSAITSKINDVYSINAEVLSSERTFADKNITPNKFVTTTVYLSGTGNKMIDLNYDMRTPIV